MEQPERESRKQHGEPAEAQRRRGQSGSYSPGPGAAARPYRQPVRAVGHSRHQTQQIPQVFLHEAPEHRRSRRCALPGVPAANLGHHVSLLRLGSAVQTCQVRPGGEYVRIDLHARSDVGGQVLSHLSASAPVGQEKGPVVRGRLLDAQFDIQHPPGVHIFPKRGRERRV